MLIMLALNGQKAQFRYPILKLFLTKWTLSKLPNFEHIICPSMVAFDRNYARLCSFSHARLCFFYKKGLLCLKIMPAYSAQAKHPLLTAASSSSRRGKKRCCFVAHRTKTNILPIILYNAIIWGSNKPLTNNSEK